MKSITYKEIIIYITGILFIIFFLKYDIGIPCVFHMLTGFYCPGCGATRAIRALMKFNIYEAFRYNSLIVILFPLGLVYFIYKYVINGRKNIPNWIWIFFLIITVIFGIFRNISAFNYLAPTSI